LAYVSESVSFLRMRLQQILLRRQKLLDRLPVTGEILRGSLLERTIRNHASGCAKCASGEGHPLAVLTVTYPPPADAPGSSVCAPNGFPRCAAGSAIIRSSSRQSRPSANSITSCCGRTKPRQRPLKLATVYDALAKRHAIAAADKAHHQAEAVMEGRTMRVDMTMTETNIH
jgi:hypothetical protein